MYTYLYQQFGPFDRHGQPLREDDDRTPTVATAAATITTVKTEMKDTMMDEFWKIMLSPPRPTQLMTKTKDLTMDDFWHMMLSTPRSTQPTTKTKDLMMDDIIFPSTSP